ncbi:hypothetical protein FQA39_LY01207 [Lamprigera yunnana]|nr:hypothetical protein FQA39_LY01207 [Lamprigera yunnana]
MPTGPPGLKLAKALKKKEKEWSSRTKLLIDKRRELLQEGEQSTIEYTKTNTAVRKLTREDRPKQLVEEIERMFKENKNMKSIRIWVETTNNITVKDKNGIEISGRNTWNNRKILNKEYLKKVKKKLTEKF